jgi:hypothetical protein
MGDVPNQVSGDRERPSALAEIARLIVELHEARPDLVKGIVIGGALIGFAVLVSGDTAATERT